MCPGGLGLTKGIEPSGESFAAEVDGPLRVEQALQGGLHQATEQGVGFVNSAGLAGQFASQLFRLGGPFRFHA